MNPFFSFSRTSAELRITWNHQTSLSKRENLPPFPPPPSPPPTLPPSPHKKLQNLFTPPINLLQETLKHIPLQPLTLIHLCDHRPDPAHDILLVVQIHLLELQLLEDALDFGLHILVLAAVAVVEQFPLLGVRALEGLVDDPAALVVHDIGADLADDLGGAVSVEVVVLDLEVLAQGDEDVVGLLEVPRRGEGEVVQGEGDGEVEAIVRGLVDDDEAVFLGGELRQVDVVLWSRQQVAELADFRLEGGGVEDLEEAGVGRVGAEVLGEEDVDGGFEHEGVVDGDHADFGELVPARLAAAGLGAVHDVVGDEEEGLQELGEPAEGGGVEELFFGEGPREEDGGGVDDGHAAVAFAAHGVVVEGLS